MVNPTAANVWKRLTGSGWRIARPVAVCYLSVVLIVMIFETWLVYPVPPLERGDWQPAELEHEDVWFSSVDGTKLHGWFVPHPNSKRAIVYCHGNAEQVGDNVDLVAHLRDTLAASVFIFDYRGYGHSQGRPHEAGCIADGMAAQSWLAKRLAVQPNEIVLMGRSLGGGVAVAVAAEQGAQALVLENTFPCAADVAAHHFRWLPVRWLMDNCYNSIARIRRYQGPLFQIHGGADTLIPPEFGRRLFDASPGARKEFIVFPGRAHNDPWPASYYARLREFLDRISSANAADGHPEPRLDADDDD